MTIDTTVGRDQCAMAACRQPAAEPPLVVNASTMPGPFEIPLCSMCREPFEAGMEAVERLVEGDAESVPFRPRTDREVGLGAER